MKTGSQLWNYGDWMLKAEYSKKRKAKKGTKDPMPGDIFKFGITQLGDDVKVYNRNNGIILFEAESYDEAQRVLRERCDENAS